MTQRRGQVAREHTALTDALADEVRRARLKSGRSQEEVAAATDISLSSYRRIERGERPPTVGQVEQMARALGIALSEMIRRAEDQLGGAPTTPRRLPREADRPSN